jgi:putative transposase
MARITRVIVPSLPHHIVQRGNRRQPTFFCAQDYRLYVAVMRDSCERMRVEVWGYCLMPNHAHLIMVPRSADDLRRAIGEAHRRYTNAVNKREGWRGHLWQGRFFSCAMDERYTLAAARYVEMNPVRAGLVKKPEKYPWSSARAHLLGRDDQLVKVQPLLARVANWSSFLHDGDPSEIRDQLRKHETTGRPLGSDAFVASLERLLRRPLKARGPGRARGIRAERTRP